MNKIEEAVELAHDNFEVKTRRWGVPLLKVPNSKVDRLECNNETVAQDYYKVHTGFIEFRQHYNYIDNGEYVAYLEINHGKSRLQLNGAIAAALIGLLGTVFSHTYSDIRCLFKNCLPDETPLVHFKSTQYGIDENKNFFSGCHTTRCLKVGVLYVKVN